MQIENFKGGATWCYRFMKRKKLAVRICSTVGQKLPDDWEKKVEDFLNFVKKIVIENNFTPNDIINMDEVPLCFDCPPNRTVDSQGSNSIPIQQREMKKQRLLLCYLVLQAALN